jgi:hypothetical protein
MTQATTSPFAVATGVRDPQAGVYTRSSVCLPDSVSGHSAAVAITQLERLGGSRATAPRLHLLCDETAVDHQFGAGDKGRFVRGQEQHAVGHFDRFAGAS